MRYHERDGLLLRPVPRSATGHRRYQPVDLRWIELIAPLRATGMPIRDIRRYAELVRRGDGNERARLDVPLGPEDLAGLERAVPPHAVAG